MEEAKKRFDEITTTVPPAPEEQVVGEVRVGKEKKKRKTVKAVVPKSK